MLLRFRVSLGLIHERADAPNAVGLLGTRSDWPSHRPTGQKDELPPLHTTPPDLRGCQSIRWLTSALKQLLQRKRPEARQVPVGTRIAPRPPDRSRRALLTHRAPPSGSGVETV